MLKIISIILLPLMGCEMGDEPEVSKSQIEVMKEEVNSEDVLSADKLMSYTKSEAIDVYGKPSSEKRFILDDAQGEFRNSISDLFTEEERQSESIKIDELTWEKDENTWITVWYQVKGDKSVPKSVFSWDKGSEF